MPLLPGATERGRPRATVGSQHSPYPISGGRRSMTRLTGTLTVAAAFVTASLATRRYIRFALERRILDMPNARSSHIVATPRGGGVAIVGVTSAIFLILGLAGLVDRRTAAGLAAGGLIVAAIGFVDDRGHVAARWRLLAHFTGAAVVLALTGTPSVIP